MEFTLPAAGSSIFLTSLPAGLTQGANFMDRYFYLNDIAISILHKKEAPITGAEGAYVLKIVEVFYRSVEQNSESLV